MKMKNESNLLIGWSSVDLTPKQPVSLRGQFHARICEGVMDPITATIMALESSDVRVVLVSCDFATIADYLYDSVRSLTTERLPELAPTDVVMNATHTHAAPDMPVQDDAIRMGGFPGHYGVDLPVMDPRDYTLGAARIIADGIVEAWRNRQPGEIGFGLGQAVVGHNRRVSYENGESRMYGRVNTPEFSHVEGYEDHSVNVLGAWNESNELTGLVVNVACTAQVDEHSFEMTADYWHDVRVELRRRFGDGIHVLAQCSASGDQSPHLVGLQERPDRRPTAESAETRMWRLSARNQRQDIAIRVADAITSILPFMEKELTAAPIFRHLSKNIELPLAASFSEEALEATRSEALECRREYERLKKDLEDHPEKRESPRWYVPITTAHRKRHWLEGALKRHEIRKTRSTIPVEAHVIRIGDVAFATNPFELFLDYGIRIKARSLATQTFVTQLAGSGTYLPTERSVAGGGYGSIPASNTIDPKGGKILVEETLKMIERLWKEEA